MTIDPKKYTIPEIEQRMAEIELAKKYEKKLRKAFKGVYSYKTRKGLLRPKKDA